ncbi:hypothetical protein GOV13_00530 [Candidatus Pacearchaeota archaeon]|nr:hypothetical protein [Candidatus Pacearchaeota archaeon]
MRFKKISKLANLVAATIIFANAVSGNVRAEEFGHKDESLSSVQEQSQILGDFALSTDFSWLNNYVFYGLTYDKKPVAQNTTTLTYLGDKIRPLDSLSLQNFVNYSTDQEEINETDGLIVGTMPLGKSFSAFGGYGLYYSPTDWFEKSQEFFGGISANSLPLNPTLTIAHDFDKGEGTYFQLSGSYSSDPVRLGKLELGAELSGRVAYNRGYWIGDENSGLSHAVVKAEFPINYKGICIAPFIEAQKSLNDSPAIEDISTYGIKATINLK